MHFQRADVHFWVMTCADDTDTSRAAKRYMVSIAKCKMLQYLTAKLIFMTAVIQKLMYLWVI